MKRLYMINGTMGIGKTTVCQYLKLQLDQSVFLDGDWCWDMHPFKVVEETKIMVINNICTLLNNFLHCSVFKNIIFCWVMHKQEIIDDILSRLDMENCDIRLISLICSEKTLRAHLWKDVLNGLRKSDSIDRSVARLPLYETLDTFKIDITGKTVTEIADAILSL